MLTDEEATATAYGLMLAPDGGASTAHRVRRRSSVPTWQGSRTAVAGETS
jgi:hypothetical protein